MDLVTMLLKIWQMLYLILAQDLYNQIEERALQIKSIIKIFRFLLEDMVCRYKCIRKITTNCGELDAHEVRMFFERCGIKLILTITYNFEGNAKSEQGHPSIVKAFVKAYKRRIKKNI